ncbi:peptidoglycan-binding domain-containing protein [Thiocystis violascens]|nr:peptidoglycan-binding domain-containing protein [Thiocystis violascens]
MTRKRYFDGCVGVAVCLLATAGAWADDPPPVPTVAPPVDERPFEDALAAYRNLSASQSRNHDRAQDITPRQMLILLEVCERTGASLGQALATGEHESAHTWNDYIRPPLRNGTLGAATGVWQFMPGTFHRIVQRFGARLLTASEAETTTGRERLDLGDGPFSDEQVRRLIQETVDGRRGANDEELQLLRHNFAVLAFAKYYLSLDSGATTPEEDYLYHFLGAGEGRRVLALARGDARDTLCVKPVEEPTPLVDTPPALVTTDAREPELIAAAILRARSLAAAEPSLQADFAPLAPSRPLPQWRFDAPLQRPEYGPSVTVRERNADPLGVPRPSIEPAIWFPVEPVEPEMPPPVSSQWGLPADSPVVTGNLGMFYRDGKGQSQPYTWAEFMEHLARRVRAKDQPALVRAKYGVGFALPGGDLPERTFDPEQTSPAAAFYHAISGDLLLPEALALGPLDPAETRQYKRRLAALLNQGEDQPLETLPPEAVSALRHLTLLPPNGPDLGATPFEVERALRAFRARVGKQEPDDPAHRNRLMPAERIALEIYEQRLARYAALQAGQQAALNDAADLNRLREMPTGWRKTAAPRIAILQTTLAEQGLLKPLTRKVVWRDKKRKKHVSHQTVPFTGFPGQATEAALDAFQWRNGLRKTQGVLDGVTLAMLGLPPMGLDLFLPPAGPQCAIDVSTETAPLCERPIQKRPGEIDALRARGARALPAWW